MSKFRFSTPPSSAGIVRFNDVNSGGIQIDPKQVLILAVAIIIGISILRLIIA